MEVVLHCATCHSKFVRGSPLVPLQRPTMTGPTSSTFWYPRIRCGRNLVCDGNGSIREWGSFSNALPLASTFLLFRAGPCVFRYRTFSWLWYGTSHGKTSAPPPARQTGTSGCELFSEGTRYTSGCTFHPLQRSVPFGSKFPVLTFMEQSWTTLLSVLDRIVLFHSEGGWNDVLDDMKTLFLLENVMLASFRVSGKNVMVPSFGNLAFDEVKSIFAHGDPVVLWSTSTTLRVALPCSKFVRGRGGSPYSRIASWA